MVDEKIQRFKLVHGVMKGAVRNLINVAHASVPSKYLIDSKDKIKHSPELANLWDAFDLAIEDIVKHNKSDFKEGNPYKMLCKIRNIGFTMLDSDSFYHTFMEYGLLHYLKIKLGNTYPIKAIEETSSKQWKEKYKELNEKI